MNPEPAHPPAQTTPDQADSLQSAFPPECIPDYDTLIISDDTPMDSIFAEKQQRLLTEPLYSSWSGPADGRPFFALANVGLHYHPQKHPLQSHVMLSMGVKLGEDLATLKNRSYFIWEMGKPPEAVIELVSFRLGRDENLLRQQYARIAIPYYVIFDPENCVRLGQLRAYLLCGKTYEVTSPEWLSDIDLGLKLWEGAYEGHHWRWLRWCDRDGRLILTGSERAERYAAKLRATGIDPDA